MVVELPDGMGESKLMPNQDKKSGKEIGNELKGLVKKKIDISSKDFFDQYHLVIDGEKATKEELEQIIESIRLLRKKMLDK